MGPTPCPRSTPTLCPRSTTTLCPRSTPTLCLRSTPTPSHLLVFLLPPSCSPRPSWPPLPSSMWPPPPTATLPSTTSSAAFQSLLLPLLMRPLESRWSKRETRPVEVQKQRHASQQS